MVSSETRNARITGVSLGVGGRDILTAWVVLDYGGSGQQFGGYHLGGHACAAFIEKTLRAVGVEQWEDLPGTVCRVRASHDKVHAIGDALRDRWFTPELELGRLGDE